MGKATRMRRRSVRRGSIRDVAEGLRDSRTIREIVQTVSEGILPCCGIPGGYAQAVERVFSRLPRPTVPETLLPPPEEYKPPPPPPPPPPKPPVPFVPGGYAPTSPTFTGPPPPPPPPPPKPPAILIGWWGDPGFDWRGRQLDRPVGEEFTPDPWIRERYPPNTRFFRRINRAISYSEFQRISRLYSGSPRPLSGPSLAGTFRPRPRPPAPPRPTPIRPGIGLGPVRFPP